MRLFRLCITLAPLFAVAGCGSSPPAAPPPPPPLAAPPPVAATPAGAAKPAAAASSKPQAAHKPEAPKKSLPPGAQLVGGSEPNFKVIPREQRPELLAMVISPDPGVNSSLMLVSRDVASPSAASTALPAGFTPVADTEFDSASGLPKRIRCEKDGAIMALVPGGIAIQGADGTPTASPRHPIDIDSFYIDVHEVTVEQFQKFREASKSEKSPPAAPSNASFPKQPAVGVNWRDATQYAKWTGRELPTESEWEKAARGVDGFTYPWGEGRPIWEHRREPGQLSDVASFRTDESAFGVFDLAGNAREWCQDFFAEDAYKHAPAAGSAAARNWAGPRTDKAARRVVKGSSNGWELWAREGFSMAERSPHIGFRCVLKVTGNPGAKSVASETAPGGTPGQPQSKAPETPAPIPTRKSAF